MEDIPDINEEKPAEKKRHERQDRSRDERISPRRQKKENRSDLEDVSPPLQGS
eukprot:CAMPEP_0185572428 /NCGR_PEP_ID=MMETSP0434-20130131/4361_1 /TAXON_ID=626734 ORGANISM="Favella taraikaensis, Strain Fe Narragansett Bay" /NCGR_SAMPLE_ID=MMETSP0434 /ASSEMBLY_ACC=CAM_ASM_000379 /LENGTH=52 /DNA_ID=CAMNT_0028188295 /DNA_START=544 /DNA_END=702 /DNA_ORIENTATION=-